MNKKKQAKEPTPMADYIASRLKTQNIVNPSERPALTGMIRAAVTPVISGPKIERMSPEETRATTDKLLRLFGVIKALGYTYLRYADTLKDTADELYLGKHKKLGAVIGAYKDMRLKMIDAYMAGNRLFDACNVIDDLNNPDEDEQNDAVLCKILEYATGVKEDGSPAESDVVLVAVPRDAYRNLSKRSKAFAAYDTFEGRYKF